MRIVGEYQSIDQSRYWVFTKFVLCNELCLNRAISACVTFTFLIPNSESDQDKGKALIWNVFWNN